MSCPSLHVYCLPIVNRGVQRFLDARGHRGSWMPEAGQIPTFSVVKKIYIFRPIFEFLLNIFRFVSQNFCSSFFLAMYHNFFYFIPKRFQFVFQNFWRPPFLVIYHIFFSQNWIIGCPRLDARGHRKPPHPLCKPLIVNLVCFYYLLLQNLHAIAVVVGFDHLVFRGGLGLKTGPGNFRPPLYRPYLTSTLPAQPWKNPKYRLFSTQKSLFYHSNPTGPPGIAQMQAWPFRPCWYSLYTCLPWTTLSGRTVWIMILVLCRFLFYTVFIFLQSHVALIHYDVRIRFYM